jgi:DNA-binding Xre family transcriptional regulator
VRRVGYHWHLRRLMAERNMFATSDLRPLLADRGVALSREQIYRLVTRTPQRLSLATLAALCDILACTPGDLVEPYPSSSVTTSRPGKRTIDGSSQGPAPEPSKASPPRPRRARIVPERP